MSGNISIAEALQITAICMGIVFVTLYVISLIIELFKIVFVKKNNKKDEKAMTSIRKEVDKTIRNLTNDEEIAVAMTAAINMSNKNKNSRLRIVSFKQIG
ncbi:OadG family protein [Clostridium sp. DL1XJH146]